MKELRFTIPGPVVPKRRARQGRTPKGAKIWYTPDETRAYEKRVAQLAWIAMLEQKVERMTGPVTLTVEVFRGKNPRVEVIVTEHDPCGWSVGPPDLDNCIKAISDAMNRRVYEDDRQVVSIAADALEE